MMPILLPPRRRLHGRGIDPREPTDAAEVSTAEARASRRAADSRPGARVDELRVLIVDDDFLFTEMLPRLLRKSVASPQLRVDSAAGVDEALQRLRAQEYDVVLCDFDLREPRTGLDVLAEAGTLARPPLRILITGHTPGEVPLSPAYDAFLDKPMTLREVVPLLAAVLGERLGVELDLRDPRAS